MWQASRFPRIGGLRSLVAALAPGLFLAAGCNTPSDQPQLAPVTGVVTLDGQPLADKQVVFSPETGRPSIGITNAAGEYELRYTARIKGAIVGPHTVTISTPRDEYQMDWRETVPREYNVDSTLTAEVENKKNQIDFELTSQPGP